MAEAPCSSKVPLVSVRKPTRLSVNTGGFQSSVLADEVPLLMIMLRKFQPPPLPDADALAAPVKVTSTPAVPPLVLKSIWPLLTRLAPMDRACEVTVPEDGPMNEA